MLGRIGTGARGPWEEDARDQAQEPVLAPRTRAVLTHYGRRRVISFGLIGPPGPNEDPCAIPSVQDTRGRIL